MLPIFRVFKDKKLFSYNAAVTTFEGLYAAYVKLVDHQIDCYASTHSEWFNLYLNNWQSDPIVMQRYGQKPYNGLVVKSWNQHWQTAQENQFCSLRHKTINDMLGITATKEYVNNGKIIRECFALASTQADVQKSDLMVTPEFLKKAFKVGFELMEEIQH